MRSMPPARNAQPVQQSFGHTPGRTNRTPRHIGRRATSAAPPGLPPTDDQERWTLPPLVVLLSGPGGCAHLTAVMYTPPAEPLNGQVRRGADVGDLPPAAKCRPPNGATDAFARSAPAPSPTHYRGNNRDSRREIACPGQAWAT